MNKSKLEQVDSAADKVLGITMTLGTTAVVVLLVVKMFQWVLG